MRFVEFQITVLNPICPVNGYESGLAGIDCGVPQGSILGCKVHHLAVDTNLVWLSNCIKKTEQTSQC